MATYLGNRQASVGGIFGSDDPPDTRQVNSVRGLPTSYNSRTPVAGAWDDASFSGRSIGLPVGIHKFSVLDRNGMHDNISSVKVKEGYKLTLYKDQDGGVPKNAMETFTGPVHVTYVGDNANDETSAIKVEPVAAQTRTGESTDDGSQLPPPPDGGGSTGDDTVRDPRRRTRRRLPVRQPQQAGFMGGNMGNIVMIVGGIGLLGAAVYTVTQD